jgi:hypothetical protein
MVVLIYLSMVCAYSLYYGARLSMARFSFRNLWASIRHPSVPRNKVNACCNCHRADTKAVPLLYRVAVHCAHLCNDNLRSVLRCGKRHEPGLPYLCAWRAWREQFDLLALLHRAEIQAQRTRVLVGLVVARVFRCYFLCGDLLLRNRFVLAFAGPVCSLHCSGDQQIPHARAIERAQPALR